MSLNTNTITMIGRSFLRPPPVCFSCGTDIKEEHYETYHQRVEIGKENGRKVVDELGFPLMCCRRMIMGDAYETRRIAGLYDYSTINSAPHL